MAGRHGYAQQQQQQQRGGDVPNGEAPGSPPSALSFLHGLSDDPMHGGDPTGGVDSVPVVQGAGPDALGLSVRCAAARPAAGCFGPGTAAPLFACETVLLFKWATHGAVKP